MKQQKFTDDQCRELVRLSDTCKGEYEREVKRRNTLASSINQKKYESLMNTFYEHIKIYEDLSPSMYVDSQGYITVGCGHFVGFNHFNFWNTTQAENIRRNLNEQMNENKLISDPSFSNLSNPEDIDAFLAISFDEFKELYQTKYVCFGFLDAKSLPFLATEGERGKNKEVRISETPINESERPVRILKAYIGLLGFALKLNARQKQLKPSMKKSRNPFIARSFYIPGYNSLVISIDTIKALAVRDILVKLGEFKISREAFDQFSEPAQLALLDLGYTGSILNVVQDAALKQDWKKLTNIELYNRPDESYKKRNDQVRIWFEQADKMKNAKVQKDLPKSTINSKELHPLRK